MVPYIRQVHEKKRTKSDLFADKNRKGCGQQKEKVRTEINRRESILPDRKIGRQGQATRKIRTKRRKNEDRERRKKGQDRWRMTEE